MKLRITISKYHSWYLFQISLQIMLWPIPTTLCWLQKYFIENIEAILTSSFKIGAKIEIQEQSFHCVSLRRRVCFCPVMSRDVSSKRVSVWLFTVKTLSFSPEFVLHHGKAKFISLTLNKSPANRSNYDYAGADYWRTVLLCLFVFFFLTHRPK